MQANLKSQQNNNRVASLTDGCLLSQRRASKVQRGRTLDALAWARTVPCPRVRSITRLLKNALKTPLGRESLSSLTDRLHSTHSIQLLFFFLAQVTTMMYSRMTSVFKSPARMIIITGLTCVSSGSMLTILCAPSLPEFACWHVSGLPLNRCGTCRTAAASRLHEAVSFRYRLYSTSYPPASRLLLASRSISATPTCIRLHPITFPIRSACSIKYITS